MSELERWEYGDPAEVMERRQSRERKKKKITRVEAEQLFKRPENETKQHPPGDP